MHLSWSKIPAPTGHGGTHTLLVVAHRRQRQVNLSELKAGQDIQGYTEKHPGSHLAQADL